MSERAVVLLGSNIDPARNLPLGAERLQALGATRFSKVYRSKAMGGGPDFMNAAALLWTDLDPAALRERLREIERDLGRVRGPDRNAPRTLDLDLVLYGALAAPELGVPDADLLVWSHVAVPAAEVAGDLPHPLTGESLFAIALRLVEFEPLEHRPEVGLAR